MGKRIRQSVEGEIRRGIFNWSVISPRWLKFPGDVWDPYRRAKLEQAAEHNIELSAAADP